MRDSTALPDLIIVPIEALVPHEESDPRRVEKLCERIREAGHEKHPPIVAPIPDTDRFVILDGANRTAAFTRLGVQHLLVQRVHYGDPGLVLDTWYHVVAGMEIQAFEAALTQITGLVLKDCSLEEAREALSTDETATYIVCASGVRKVGNREGRPLKDLHLLNAIVNTYKGRADIYRASNDIWEKQSPYYPDITALVIFPTLSPSDIMMAARNGEMVPSGITRHIIPNRALNVNFPLSVLYADWTLERKREWFKEWLLERMAANAIRYYAEATFTFDE